MRFSSLVLLAPMLVCAAAGQDGVTTSKNLPTDARGMLAAAEPLYDFRSAILKPWHLKGKYQLFDENGNPGEQGVFEYWWVAPEVYRSTWSRPIGSRTEWHTKDGRTMYVATGKRILELERELPSFLVSAVPDASLLKPGEEDVKSDELRVGTSMLPCAEIEGRNQSGMPIATGVRTGTYCFDVSEPVLRVLRISNTEYLEFDHPRKMQGRILPGEIKRSYSARNMFTFALDKIDEISNHDAALIPAADAKEAAPEDAASAVLKSVEKQTPVEYPYEARRGHLTGIVMFDALIGADGKVQDLYLLASPSPILAKAAKKAALQWKYKPYLLKGEPQDVSVRIIIGFGYRY